MFTDVVFQIIDEEEKLFLVGLTLFAIIAVVSSALRKVITGVAKERTKREIAAYIAEGSMSPEQGERLLRAKPTKEC